MAIVIPALLYMSNISACMLIDGCMLARLQSCALERNMEGADECIVSAGIIWSFRGFRVPECFGVSARQELR